MNYGPKVMLTLRDISGSATGRGYIIRWAVQCFAIGSISLLMID